MELYDQLKELNLKSYISEVGNLKQGIVEHFVKLEELLDMDALEAGRWHFKDLAWKLKPGKTVEDAVRLIASKGAWHYGAIPHSLGLLKCYEEGGISCEDGRAFYSSIVMELPPFNFVRHLLDCSYLSLFECLFLISYVTEAPIHINSADIVSDELAAETISPRNPKTLLKPNDPMNKRFHDRSPHIPDMSWLLTFEEAEQWAFNSFGFSLKYLKDSLPEQLGNDVNADTTLGDNSDKEEGNAYFDESHAMFSSELQIAIKASRPLS